MGEVRARIKITNAVDEELARLGKLAPDQVRTYVADALVDHGAVRTVIPPRVVEQLGKSIHGQRVTEYADGRKDLVGITGPIILEWNGRDTLEEALILGDAVLIGQTVLEKLDLHVDCAGNRLIPNPAQPVTKVK